MSSMVCQGLQSCLEPRLVEPRALGLKMVATKALFLKSNSLSVSDTDSSEDVTNDDITTVFEDNNNKDNIITKKEDDLGGWSFIQTLTNSSQNASNNIGAKEDSSSSSKPAYVLPVYKRQLSNKSLELCTETLGSETGSDIGEDIDFSSDSEANSSKSPTKETSKLRNSFGCTIIKKAKYGSLPPPLTSISGSTCYTIKPHREGGRLVMKAVLNPTPNSYFQAERRDGRLRLHYIKNSSTSESPFTSDSEQEEEEEAYLDEERNGEEVGMERIQRPSRCKEGGRNSQDLLIWEPFWVAT